MTVVYGRLYAGGNGVTADDLTLKVDGISTDADADFNASFIGGGTVSADYDALSLNVGFGYRF